MPDTAVVVTGASTGIGRAAALRLDGMGMRVFAGVRKEDDARSLSAEAGSRLRPLILDVTNEASVDSAAETVRGELDGGRLLGVVNNAGIAVGGPVEFVPLAEWRRQLDVNVVGPVAMIQRFLPLLREHH